MTEPALRSFASRLNGALNPRLRQLETALAVERERITKLEAELDELRHDSLRIAELTDLIEQRLAPPAAKH